MTVRGRAHVGFRMRVGAVVAAVAGMASPFATAQEWAVYGGVAGRIEYNDNYFFTAPGQSTPGNPAVSNDPQSAFTLSLIPFVAAARRTEVSEVTALLSIGDNQVWGPSPSENYLSGSLVLSGSLREARSTWSGSASYTRSPQLQNVIVGTDVLLALAYTDAAGLAGSYSYALTERWSVGASAGGYYNRYDSVEGGYEISADRGFNLGGNVGYAFSDRTQLTWTLGYMYYASDITRNDAVTTTLGVVHQFSPQLTVSGSVGGFWSDITARERLPGASTPVTAGESRRDSGPFYGGSISYAFSEFTRFGVSLSESLTPSGTGVLSKSDNAAISLSHDFSDRLTGRFGASYTRTTFPAALDGSYDDDTLGAQAGISYRLAERWKLDAGYQYTSARYSQVSSEPRSNLVFVSVAYNWPGSSFTGWLGRPMDMQGMPGAGPLSLPERSTRTPGSSPSTTATEIAPFDALTLP